MTQECLTALGRWFAAADVQSRADQVGEGTQILLLMLAVLGA